VCRPGGEQVGRKYDGWSETNESRSRFRCRVREVYIP
jgi:hypothetical protein